MPSSLYLAKKLLNSSLAFGLSGCWNTTTKRFSLSAEERAALRFFGTETTALAFSLVFLSGSY